MPILSNRKHQRLGLRLGDVFRVIRRLGSAQSDIVLVYLTRSLEHFEEGLEPSPLLEPTRITLDQLIEQLPKRDEGELADALTTLHRVEPTITVLQVGISPPSESKYPLIEIVRRAPTNNFRPEAAEWWIRAGQWAYWEMDHLSRIYLCRIASAQLSANNSKERDMIRELGLKAADIALSFEAYKPISMSLRELLDIRDDEQNEKLVSTLSRDANCNTLAHVLDVLQKRNIFVVSSTTESGKEDIGNQ